MDADAIVVGAGLAGLAAAGRAGRRRPAGAAAGPGAGAVASAGRRSGRSAGCSSSTPRSSAGWASRTRSTWPCRTGSARRSSTGREDHWPRQWAEAYVDFAAGEKRSWLRQMGHRFFPVVGWAERGGGRADGHGNSVPRFHVTWGTGPGVVAPFERRVREHVATGRISVPVPAPGRRADRRPAVPSPASAARSWSRRRSCAARRQSAGRGRRLRAHRAGGDRHLRRHRRRPRPGPQGAGRRGSARRRSGWSPACPPTSTAGCWRSPRPPAAASSTPTGCGTTPRACGTGTRSGPTTASGSCPARPRCGSTPTGKRLPAPYFPGFDTLGTLQHLMATGYDYSWFVLTQKIIEKEFALSGSEQNPDLTGKDVKRLLSRVRAGAPGRSRRSSSTARTSWSRTTCPTWSRGMNTLTDAAAHRRRPAAAADRRPATARWPTRSARTPRSPRSAAPAPTAATSSIRVASPHRLLDPEAGPLIAVRLNILTRKTLGGLQTDLDGRVLNAAGDAAPGPVRGRRGGRLRRRRHARLQRAGGHLPRRLPVLRPGRRPRRRRPGRLTASRSGGAAHQPLALRRLDEDVAAHRRTAPRAGSGGRQRRRRALARVAELGRPEDAEQPVVQPDRERWAGSASDAII